MMNTNVITMQNIILFKCMIFLQLLKDYFLVVLSCFSWAIEVTSILLKENSVKPNIKADRSLWILY